MLQCPLKAASVFGMFRTGESLQPGGRFLDKHLLPKDLRTAKVELRRRVFLNQPRQEFTNVFLIQGASGQLGQQCGRVFSGEAWELTREQLDITDHAAVDATIGELRP